MASELLGETYFFSSLLLVSIMKDRGFNYGVIIKEQTGR